jgi:hypothetical protein
LRKQGAPLMRPESTQTAASKAAFCSTVVIPSYPIRRPVRKAAPPFVCQSNLAR